MRQRAAAALTVLAALAGVLVLSIGVAGPAAAAPSPAPVVQQSQSPSAAMQTGPTAPTAPVTPAAPSAPTGSTAANSDPGSVTVSVNGVNGVDGKPSSSIVALLALTVLAVAPALLLLCTSFTKIIVVLSLTRNALGLTSVPPNQVLAGLALFLSIFIMGPTLSAVNHDGIQPYLKGEPAATAFHDGVQPLKTFMLDHTRKDELALFVKVSHSPKPKRDDVPLSTLVPAFVLSELRAAFIIGFVIYVPFLVIDMVVSASLMSLGMMMLPPVTVSLPFKLLLFVLVNGWGLIITALVASYHG